MERGTHHPNHLSQGHYKSVDHWVIIHKQVQQRSAVPSGDFTTSQMSPVLIARIINSMVFILSYYVVMICYPEINNYVATNGQKWSLSDTSDFLMVRIHFQDGRRGR